VTEGFNISEFEKVALGDFLRTCLACETHNIIENSRESKEIEVLLLGGIVKMTVVQGRFVIGQHLEAK